MLFRLQWGKTIWSIESLHESGENCLLQGCQRFVLRTNHLFEQRHWPMVVDTLAVDIVARQAWTKVFRGTFHTPSRRLRVTHRDPSNNANLAGKCMKSLHKNIFTFHKIRWMGDTTVTLSLNGKPPYAAVSSTVVGSVGTEPRRTQPGWVTASRVFLTSHESDSRTRARASIKVEKPLH